MATYTTWREAVAELRKATASVTDEQKKLAAFAGVQLPDELPKLVAAVRLSRALASELCSLDANPSTQSTLDYLETLNAERISNQAVQDDSNEAGAWIEFYQLEQRCHVLEQLQLESGDIVTISSSEGMRTYEVISIGNNGRIYFKGGLNSRAWPDMVTLLCRKSDRSSAAQTFRTTAANQASARLKTNSWSLAKEQSLAEFKVELPLTREDVEQLQAVIDGANSEEPIQRFLEDRPQILAALVGANLDS